MRSWGSIVNKGATGKFHVSRWLVVCVLVIGAVAITYFIVPAALERSKAATNRAAELFNMRQIMIAMLNYASDHDNQFPPDLGTLALKGLIIPDDVLTPGRAAPTLPPSDPAALKIWVNDNAAIVYLYDPALNSGTDPNRVVLLGPIGSDGANIGYADARIVFKPRAEAEQIISAAKASLPSR